MTQPKHALVCMHRANCYSCMNFGTYFGTEQQGFRSSAGESVVVARGGRGGMGVTRPTREDNARLQSRKRRFLVSYF